MTNADKLRRLRQFVPDSPDIYNIEGLEPNGLTGVPDRIWLFPWGWLDIQWIGDWHDYRYWLGGSGGDRLAADLRFRQLIEAMAEDYRWFNRRRIRRIARIYYRGVRALGVKHFNYQKAVSQ